MKESGVVPIPGWPGYFINAMGNVFSEYGPLSPNASNRYSLRDKTTKKRTSVTVSTLLVLAGFANKEIIIDRDKPVMPKFTNPARLEELNSLRKSLEVVVKEKEALKKKCRELARRIIKAERVNNYNQTFNATLWARLRRFERDFNAINENSSAKRRLLTEETYKWEADGELRELDFNEET